MEWTCDPEYSWPKLNGAERSTGMIAVNIGHAQIRGKCTSIVAITSQDK